MRSTATMRRLWAPACKRKLVLITLHSGARISVAVEAEAAFRALDQVMAHHGYHPRREDTGAFVCRQITGGSGYSLHAYGIAADFSWRSNPYGRRLITDMPRAMVEDIERIRTRGGARVFRWGGDWDDDNQADDGTYDAMHYEVQASPTELAQGIDPLTVVGGAAVPLPMPPAPHPIPTGAVVPVNLNLPVLAEGDKGEDVRKLQRVLTAAGHAVKVDGGFGPGTKAAVVAYQRHPARKLKADGIVGGATWAWLASAVLPTK